MYSQSSYQGQYTSSIPVEAGTMCYFVIVLFIVVSVMRTVNVSCSDQASFVHVWDERYIYPYTLVYMTKFVLKYNCINLYLPLNAGNNCYAIVSYY